MRETPEGLVPEGDGWFVVNVADARAFHSERAGLNCPFESRDSAPFPEFGINIRVAEPGQPTSMYHAENAQEAFLVLAGECVLVIEDEERRLRRWDFVHCPAGTRHVLVGAGDGPCAILMVGTRPPEEVLEYPVSEVAARHGASVEKSTPSEEEAYAGWPDLTPRRMPWPPK
jgi:uncharacterized cupin superfamily protein